MSSTTVLTPVIGNAESLDELIQQQLEFSLTIALEMLQGWAQSGQLEAFSTVFEHSDLASSDHQTLQSLYQAWQQGDFAQLPAIELLSAADLNGALGAFSASTQTIYLAADLLNAPTFQPENIARIFIEEVGHFVDSQVNAVDAPGDEGALFAALVEGHQLSDSQLATLQSENDHITLQVNGQAIEAEAMAPYEGGNLDQFQEGVEDFLDTLEEAIAQVIAAQELPLIGSALANVSDAAQQFVAEMRETIATEIAAITDLTPTTLATALTQALGAAGMDILQEDIVALATADDLQFDLVLNRNLVNLGSDAFDLSLGDTGLSLDIEGSAELGVNLDLHLRLGLNEAGFYLDTAVEDELSVNLSATLPELEATGTLGFMQVELADNNSNLSSSIAIDLQDSGDADTQLSLAELGDLVNTLDASISGGAVLDVDLSTGTVVSALPAIGTNLVLNWDFANANFEGFETSAPTINFNGVSLDMGSFFGGFVGPVFQGITDVLEPVMPVVGILNTEVPILDAKIIDVAQALAEAGLGDFNEETVQFIEYVAQIAEILNILGELSVDGDTITLGDFSVLAGEVQSLQADVDALGQIAGLSDGGSSFAEAISNNTRFEFPMLTDPASLIGLFLGQPTDIFRLELPTIGFGVDYSTNIPILGPLSVEIGGAFAAAAALGFGFDTTGIQDFATGGFTNPALIANGFYVSQPNNPEAPAPIESPEGGFTLGLGAGVEAGLNVNLGVISGGVSAGLVAQLFTVLTEGKAYLDDFVVPACQFELLGALDAFVAAKLQVGFGPFSINKRIELVRETLVDFRAGCSSSSEDHNQATVGEDGEAVLSVGDAAANLGPDITGGDADEVFTVTHVSGEAGNETIAVEAYGAVWEYSGVSQITANAGNGNDIIELVGILSDSELTGGSGDDQLLGGDGVDQLNGGIGADFLSGGDNNDVLLAGPGDDFLEGGAGDDILDGGLGTDSVSYDKATGSVTIDLPGNVVLDGDGTEDTITSIEQFELSDHNDQFMGDGADNTVDGGAGDDILNGGAGNDFVIGGPGADTINGHSETDATSYFNSKAGVHVDLETGAVFSGGGSDADGDQLISIENLISSGEDDEIRGDDAENMLYATWGDDVVEGRGGADELNGGPGNDTVEYVSSDAGVIVSLQAAALGDAFSVVGQGGDAEGDRLAMVVNEDGSFSDRNTFENLTGSDHTDILTGDAGRNVIKGLEGDDTLNGEADNDILMGGAGGDIHNGGNGLDWADYSDSPTGVTVDLQANTGSNGHAAGDTFSSIENLKGSSFVDDLTGNGQNNHIDPGLKTIGGIEVIDGGGETDALGDLLSLNYSSTNIALNGGYNLGSNHFGEFTGHVIFEDIERLHVVASYLDDTIRGGAGDDFINSGGGNDTILGGQGRNLILADDGDDYVINLNDASGQLFEGPTPEDAPIFWLDGGQAKIPSQPI